MCFQKVKGRFDSRSKAAHGSGEADLAPVREKLCNRSLSLLLDQPARRHPNIVPGTVFHCIHHFICLTNDVVGRLSAYSSRVVRPDAPMIVQTLIAGCPAFPQPRAEQRLTSHGFVDLADKHP